MPATPIHARQQAVRLRTDQLTKRRANAGLTTNSALALAVGVAESTIGRVLAGQVEVSAAFIAGLLKAFPGSKFDDLFEVVDTPTGT